MPITGRKFTDEQRMCLQEYERISGVEPMYQEDFDLGEMSFEELWRHNVHWLEDVVASISNINIPCDHNDAGEDVEHFSDRTVVIG